ncbi:MAG TPA: biopolymer transporter ExbD [Candidatus Polarisedimenticolaceae bacterium]|nr:biopolymer transporter ExbD [Candidatus Polarisedimenticolaceae bacterium]
MRVRSHPVKKARIEIVPLIDVVFFLLATFVMVSLSMTRNQGMQVQLPSASSATRQSDADQAVTLTVMNSGELFYNKEKITPQQLPFKLQTYKAGSKDPKVIVNAAADADFQRVVAVLDEARRQGIAKVGISTAKP